MRRVPALRPAAAVVAALAILATSCGGAVQSASGAAAPTAAPAAPAAQAPAVAQPATKAAVVVYADTVSGNIGTTDEEKAMYSCVQKNRFPQGESIVWRVRVLDGGSGKAIDDKGLKAVELTLPDGTVKPLKYGPHPKGKTDDYFWTASFKIPADYPTGAFKYSVKATSLEGATGEYSQFNVASSLLQVVAAGSR